MGIRESLAKRGISRIECEVADIGKHNLTYEQGIYESICFLRVGELERLSASYEVMYDDRFFKHPTTIGIQVSHPKLKGLHYDDYIKDPQLLHYAVRTAFVYTKDNFAHSIAEDIMRRRFGEFYSLVKEGLPPRRALMMLADGKIASDIDRRFSEYIVHIESEPIVHIQDLLKMKQLIMDMPTWIGVPTFHRTKVRFPEI